MPPETDTMRYLAFAGKGRGGGAVWELGDAKRKVQTRPTAHLATTAGTQSATSYQRGPSHTFPLKATGLVPARRPSRCRPPAKIAAGKS